MTLTDTVLKSFDEKFLSSKRTHFDVTNVKSFLTTLLADIEKHCVGEERNEDEDVIALHGIDFLSKGYNAHRKMVQGYFNGLNK